jgi:drug/metabolite transporter (DMT)-like permease
MPEVLALCSALVFGTVHFLSGLLARRADSFAVALYGQFGGVVLVGIAALLIPDERVTMDSLAWGAFSGLGTGIGVAFLYRGLSRGKMSVVAPLSDVAAVALPVLVGVTLLSESPSILAWGGVLLGGVAMWLVPRTGQPAQTATVAGTADGLVAGAGFALQFIAISRVDLDAGAWPIMSARIAAAGTIFLLARHAHARLDLPFSLRLPAALVGAAGSGAIVLYLLATQHQLVSLVTVLAALYPAVPVLLALLFLRERLARVQVLGLVCAASAITLITLG